MLKVFSKKKKNFLQFDCLLHFFCIAFRISDCQNTFNLYMMNSLPGFQRFCESGDHIVCIVYSHSLAWMALVFSKWVGSHTAVWGWPDMISLDDWVITKPCGLPIHHICNKFYRHSVEVQTLHSNKIMMLCRKKDHTWAYTAFNKPCTRSSYGIEI